MGRSVESVRQGVNGKAARWARSARALPEGKQQVCGEKLAALAKTHSSEAFFVCDDPLEAALFSVLVEMIQHRDERGREGQGPDVDP
ncbi:hypothetical protein [uncultured Methanoregula sp.]|uniref:hypothetical protein n=1 Tax=uncultured Methanoregula sp. TaxID=1005933 RepID=UPI002AAA831D|nr:hypothetical protein [uncultured Methanoregula sp.]